MLVDLRRYTVVPGKLKAYLAVYEKHGMHVQRRHLGDPIGYFIAEAGTINQVVHLWCYRDHLDRQTRRGAMEADIEWQTYKKMTEEGGYLQRQESQFLMSAPWSKI